MRYDFSPTGYTITDELVNRASTQPQFLSHDLIKSSSIDVWTGPGNTGTRLIKNVDYSLTIKDIKRSEMAGFDIYTLFAIINPAFLSVNVYVSFVTCGDYVSIAGIQDIIDDMVDIPSIPTPGQKAALAGSRGTPGSGNKYLTQDSIGNEVCALVGGVIPAGVIPGYIDDLQEVYVVGSTPYAAGWLSLTAGGAPLSPVGGRLYLVVSAGNYYHKSYRWAGSAYGITGSDLALGETSSTAYRGDRGKMAYDHSQAAHAPSGADNTQGAINSAATKATPVDADVFGFLDSAASFILKKMTAANVKAWLKAYFDTLYTGAGGGGSVDNTSRVAEYTGDGIPLIPDNVAGRTYFQDAWATTDGFSATNGTISVSGGNLVFNKTSTVTYNMYADKSLSFSAKVAYLKVTALQNLSNFTLSGVGGAYADIASTGPIKSGETKLVSAYDAGAYTTLRLLALITAPDRTGELAKVDVVYIGTGAYDTPALDRAGNGNNLSLTAVTPVNGKYGKEMSFNGSTSYAQASSPVIGTTGTVAVRFKINALKDFNMVYNNYSATTNGVYFRIGVSGQLVIRVNPQLIDPLQTLVTGVYYTYILQWDGTTIRLYKDGVQVYSVAQSSAHVVGTNNLTFGRDAGSAANFSDIAISHFRYDSRIWTADEALAWSVNPGPDDSLSMSENPSAGDVMLWPDSGVSFLRSDNVGSGWATALAASRYSLGTRALSTTSTTSTAAIPAGEWYVSLIIDANTTGAIKVQTQADGWVKIFQGASASVQTVFYAGLIKSDGTNVIVEKVSGSGTVYIDRVNVG